MNKLNHPTYDETVKIIEQLKTIEWESYNGKDLDSYVLRMHKKLTNISKLNTSFLLHTPYQFPFNFNFFRVRNFDDIKNPNLRAEYSYPPACFSTINLRANLIGNPVFYCADHPFVALVEYLVRWQDERNYVDSTFVISNWQLKKGERFWIAPYIEERLEDINEFTTLASFSNEQFKRKVDPSTDDDTIDAMRLLKNYLAKLFIEDEKRTISSFLGHHNIYRNPIKPPILIYPSVKAEKGMNNYAMHPNFVDEYLLLSHIWKIRVNSIEKVNNEMKFSFQMLNSFGYVRNHYINWTTISGNEIQIRQQYRKDFGEEINLEVKHYM